MLALRATTPISVLCMLGLFFIQWETLTMLMQAKSGEQSSNDCGSANKHMMGIHTTVRVLQREAWG